jgi:hypothetical protein
VTVCSSVVVRSRWRGTSAKQKACRRQIADRLGRLPATIKAYFSDPIGEKARAVKALLPRPSVALRRLHPSPPSGSASTAAATRGRRLLLMFERQQKLAQ